MLLKSALDGVGVAFVPREGAPEGYARHFDTIEAARENCSPDSRRRGTGDGSFRVTEPARLAPLSSARPGRSVRRTSRRCSFPSGTRSCSATRAASRACFGAYETGLGGNLHAGFAGDVSGEASGKVIAEGASCELGRYVDVRIDFTVRLSADRTATSQRTRPGRDTEDYGVDMLGSGLEQVFEGNSVVRWSSTPTRPTSIVTEAEEGTRVTVRLLEPGGAVAQQELDMSGTMTLRTGFSARPRVGSARQR